MSRKPEELNRLLRVLASGPRRRILSQLRRGPQALASLATLCELATGQVGKEVQALSAAGLVQVRAGACRTGAVYELHGPAVQALDTLLDELRPAGGRGFSAGPRFPALDRATAEEDEIDLRTQAFARQFPDVPPAVYEIGQRMLRLGVHVNQALADAAAELDLLGVELLLLDSLLLAEPHNILTPTQLRSRLHITQGGITKCIARLEAMGLVKRVPDPSDGRGVLVKMQPRARQLMKRGDLWGADAVASLQMEPARRTQLSELLREMLSLADQEALRREQARRKR